MPLLLKHDNTLFILYINRRNYDFNVINLNHRNYTLNGNINIRRVRHRRNFSTLNILHLRRANRRPPNINLRRIPMNVPNNVTRLPQPTRTIRTRRHRRKDIINIITLQRSNIMLHQRGLVFRRTLPMIMTLPQGNIRRSINKHLLSILPMNKVPRPHPKHNLPRQPRRHPRNLNSTTRRNRRTNNLLKHNTSSRIFRHGTIRRSVTTRNRLSYPNDRTTRPTTIMRYTTTSSPRAIQRNSFFRRIPTSKIRLIILHQNNKNIRIRTMPLFTTRVPTGDANRARLTILNPLVTTNLFQPKRTPKLFKGAMVSRFNSKPPTLPFQHEGDPKRLCTKLTTMRPRGTNHTTHRQRGVRCRGSSCPQGRNPLFCTTLRLRRPT